MFYYKEKRQSSISLSFNTASHLEKNQKERAMNINLRFPDTLTLTWLIGILASAITAIVFILVCPFACNNISVLFLNVLIISSSDHPFSVYKELRNVSFSESFAYMQNEWTLLNLASKTAKSMVIYRSYHYKHMKECEDLFVDFCLK